MAWNFHFGHIRKPFIGFIAKLMWIVCILHRGYGPKIYLFHGFRWRVLGEWMCDVRVWAQAKVNNWYETEKKIWRLSVVCASAGMWGVRLSSPVANFELGPATRTRTIPINHIFTSFSLCHCRWMADRLRGKFPSERALPWDRVCMSYKCTVDREVLSRKSHLTSCQYCLCFVQSIKCFVRGQRVLRMQNWNDVVRRPRCCSQHVGHCFAKRTATVQPCIFTAAPNGTRKQRKMWKVWLELQVRPRKDRIK